MRDAGAVSLRSYKLIFTSIIHDIIQIIVAVVSSVKDPHSEPVGVEVSVEGHGEHDGHDVAVVVQVGVEQVVGEDADGSGRGAGRLVEHCAGSGAGTHHGWEGVLTAAALSEHPENRHAAYQTGSRASGLQETRKYKQSKRSTCSLLNTLHGQSCVFRGVPLL